MEFQGVSQNRVGISLLSVTNSQDYPVPRASERCPSSRTSNSPKSRGSSDGSQPAVSFCLIGSLSDTPVLGPLRCKSWGGGGNDATTDMSLWSEEVSQTVIRLVLSFRVAHMPPANCSSVSVSECAIQR